MSSHSHGESPCRGRPDSLERAVLLLAIGGLLAACFNSVSRTHRRRLSGRSAAPPWHAQTWEGEGGRPLPDGQIAPDSPSPAVPAPPP